MPTVDIGEVTPLSAWQPVRSGSSGTVKPARRLTSEEQRRDITAKIVADFGKPERADSFEDGRVTVVALVKWELREPSVLALDLCVETLRSTGQRHIALESFSESTPGGEPILETPRSRYELQAAEVKRLSTTGAFRNM